jgi:hypothetical protein
MANAGEAPSAAIANRGYRLMHRALDAASRMAADAISPFPECLVGQSGPGREIAGCLVA